MIQVIFIALLVVALFAGFFSLYAPHHSVNPLKFALDSSGFDTIESVNTKETKQINLTMAQGIAQIREKMDDIALKRDSFLNSIQDQQVILKKINSDAKNILLTSQDNSQKGNSDLLQLQGILSEMQNSQQLLVACGQDLVSLNNQIEANRKLVSDQIDESQFSTGSPSSSLQQNLNLLQNQTSDFFDKAADHEQQVQDQIDDIQNKLEDMANKTKKSGSKKPVDRILDKVQDNVQKLTDLQTRNKAVLQDARVRFCDFKELLDDIQQHSKDLIEEENQKQQDEQSIIQQRIDDQRQRMQDQRDSRDN